MKVFLSWSGSRSRAVALALKDWLPLCIQSLDPWMSAEDIDKGAQWPDAVSAALTSTNGQGIFCVTPENVASPWLNFEAGAVASQGGKARVRTLLLGIEPVDMKPPLSLFQSTTLHREEMQKLLQSLNASCEKPVAERVLLNGFDRNWDDFHSEVTKALEAGHPVESPPKGTSEVIAELVGITRRMETALAEQGAYLRKVAQGSGRTKLSEAMLKDWYSRGSPGAELGREVSDPEIAAIVSGRQTPGAAGASLPSRHNAIARLIRQVSDDEEPETGA